MLDKAEYSAFQSTLNSSIVSYRIVCISVSDERSWRSVDVQRSFFCIAYRYYNSVNSKMITYICNLFESNAKRFMYATVRSMTVDKRSAV